MLRADLHIHSEYSMDCSMPLQQIVNRCLEIGINCIAIADHGTIEGALKMQSLAPFPVIVAEEILTPHGEIMGMFLKEGIPSGLSVEQTISRIRAQDGLVGVPHPFDTIRHSALGNRIIEDHVAQIDFIEVFNARGIFPWPSNKARLFAEEHGIPGTAGSDAHILQESGKAYVEMPEFNGRDEFLTALAAATIYGNRSNPTVHFSTVWRRMKNRLRWQ